MIRAATLDDMPRLVEMAQAFYLESGFAQETEFCPDSFEQTARHLIDGGGFFVAQIGDKLAGMAAALAYPFYFNRSHKTAQELFWWMEPELRGGVSGVRLLKALEAWAKSQGCETISMIALPYLAGSPAASLYERTGYRASEQTFIRSL